MIFKGSIMSVIQIVNDLTYRMTYCPSFCKFEGSSTAYFVPAAV